MVKRLLYCIVIQLFILPVVFSEDVLNVVDKITTDKAVVVVDNLNFRESPEIKAKSIGKLNTGDIVEIISIEKNKSQIGAMKDYWYKVKFKKQEGYLYGFFLSEYRDNHIVINNKNGVLLFLDSANNLISKKEYLSYYLVKEKLKTNKETEKKAEIVSIINDKFAVVKTIYFYYVDSEFLISDYTIYTKDGAEIVNEKGIPFVYYSKKFSYLILNKAILGKNNRTEYLNKINIYSLSGKPVKELSVKMQSKYKDEFNRNEIMLNNTSDRFIWVNSSKAMILDLKRFKVNYTEFKEITKYDPKKVLINLEKVKLKKDKLNIVLLPFNFQEDIDHDKVLIDIKL